jgi:dipeptidyl aminopeptidase/acylaminoacyl peptidase
MGGSPEEFPDKYRAYSPLENINNLKKPLLIIAGKKDTQIPYQINAVAFHEQATKNKKNTRLILFDDEGHLIQDPKNRKIFQKEVDDFLKN